MCGEVEESTMSIAQVSTKKIEQSVKGWMVKDWIVLILMESNGHFSTASEGEEFKALLNVSPCVRAGVQDNSRPTHSKPGTYVFSNGTLLAVNC